MNRRGFLGSILALAAAPAIVRADSLMRVVPLGQTILTFDEDPLFSRVTPLITSAVEFDNLAFSLRTPSLVTREALRILHETQAMMGALNRDWEATKVGASKTIRIRRPQIYRPPILTA